MLSRLDVAQCVRALLEMRDRCDELLVVLLPDEDAPRGCPHPPDAIEDCSSMGDDETLYRCTRCGAEQPLPFHTIEE